jgi:hypothetical protein
VAEQKQTKNRATGKLNRNPDNMLRKMEPGIAKDWRLRSESQGKKADGQAGKQADRQTYSTIHFCL